MEQQFKFRGFYNGEPVYFTFDSLMGDRNGIPTVYVNNEAVSIHILKDISQFTGLKDKNDKEIYGGDIVMWGNTSSQIIFLDGYFAVKSKNGLENILCNELDLIEKIGNIHQNPELLKE